MAPLCAALTLPMPARPQTNAAGDPQQQPAEQRRSSAQPQSQGTLAEWSEQLGRAMQQGISIGYAYALLRDGVTNAFREVWPVITVQVLHRHP